MDAKPPDSTDGHSSELLDPVADGWSVRLRTILGSTHPVFGVLTALVLSYVVLSLLLAALGMIVTHVLAHSSVGGWDLRADRWLAIHRTRSWNSVSADLTDIGNTLSIIVVGAVVTVFLAIRRWSRPALFLVTALSIELSVFLSSNRVVGRSRPPVKRLGVIATTQSWPSGHVAATAALYGGIAVLVVIATRRLLARIAAWSIAGALTSGVAMSRVYRGAHYPSDVIAGALLGIGALVAAVLVIRTWPAHRRDGSRN